MLQLTFNPGLTLTGFRTTRPWVWSSLNIRHGITDWQSIPMINVQLNMSPSAYTRIENLYFVMPFANRLLVSIKNLHTFTNVVHSVGIWKRMLIPQVVTSVDNEAKSAGIICTWANDSCGNFSLHISVIERFNAEGKSTAKTVEWTGNVFGKKRTSDDSGKHFWQF